MAISALRRLCVPFLVVAIAIALLALSSGGSKADWIPNTPQFQPLFDFRLCNDLPPTFSGPAALQGTGDPATIGQMDCTPDTTPGGSADISAMFVVPYGHLAYDQSFYVTTGGGGTPPATGETRLPGFQIDGPYDPTYAPQNPEDGGATCADTVDNSGVGAPDGSADADDPDCHTTPGTYDGTNDEDGVAACADTVDNSGVGAPDGSADTDDPDCHDPSGTYDGTNDEDGVAACADTVDNSGVGAPNGSTDADDPDCYDDPGAYQAGNTEDGLAACEDTLDNSGVGAPDGSTDADDPDCYDDPGTYQAGNDEDGVAGACGNGSDDGDADGGDAEDIDCYDGAMANYNAALPEDGLDACEDTLDQGDADGADAEDTDCYDGIGGYDAALSVEDGKGTCADGGDNGGNDGADTEDTDCYDGFAASYDTDLQEDGVANVCDDTLDNDGDGADIDDGTPQHDSDCWYGVGAPGGGLLSEIKLGLAANPCSNAIFPDFIWWDSETDTSDSVACDPEGTDNRWNNMAIDGTDGYAGQADATSPIVTQFPDCTAKLFDPDGPGGKPPVQPNWRGAGLTQVPPGADWQMLQNIEFAPGVLQAAFASNKDNTRHPFAKLDASLGYINYIVLNDPSTVILQPNPISDFCTDLSTMGMIKGVVGTVDRITQPTTPGSYGAQARTQSYRDADGDGIENNFDTCAWTPNLDDPWVTNGTDFDMMDPACDQNPANPGTYNADEDGDGYLNSQDWCPKVANPLPAGETDSESAQPYNMGGWDGGPPQDAIGDDCDSEQGGDDNYSDGLYFDAVHIDSVCIGETDADLDGYCADDDPNDASPGIPAPNPTTKVDFLGDHTTDTDGDGYTDAQEWVYLGTDPNSACPATATKNDEEPDAWPPDFDDSQVINILDVNQVLPPAFGTTGASAGWNSRVDLAENGVINILDVNATLPPTFGMTCP